MVWNDYMHAYYYGIKKYLVGEDMSKLEQMRKKFKRLDILFLLFNFCVIILFIYFRIQVVKNVVFYTGLAVAASYVQTAVSSWFF